jgi:methylenetetrahydrofolate dehydrogenase (NADP+)/methenyltetrahydrofolate cyclohydrolase
MQKIIEAAAKRAGAITPVQAGVRPMTTMCLLRNTLFAAARRRGVTNGKI